MEERRHESHDMGSRGVTRMRHAAGETSDDDRRRMHAEHHRKTLWIPWVLAMLGLWLVTSALSFSHQAGQVLPAGGRDVPGSLAERAALMFWSDLSSGALLGLFGLLALSPKRPWAFWGAAAVGTWLTFAPIVFWSPTAAGYLNDTLVGALAVALSILVPGMPGMILRMEAGPERPPGWSYNPSSWAQRWILAATGFAGWLVSRALAAYQLGYVGTAWDPFFGAQTERVLTSAVSRQWPISDAALGAAAYTFECLMAFMGGPNRWRTMPWMVTLFGILVIPLGLVHIALVISQPVAVGAWCTLCLLAAAIMLPMIPLEVDEVVAMGQFLRKSKKAGRPFWRTFWRGGTVEGGGPDDRSPDIGAAPREVIPGMFWGVSVPWTLAISALLGIWLMAAPAVLEYSGTTADSDRLAGAVAVVVAVVCFAEVLRAGRFLNVLLGAWIAASGWLLAGGSTAGRWSSLIAGALVALLALPRGPVRERYGAWDRLVR